MFTMALHVGVWGREYPAMAYPPPSRFRADPARAAGSGAVCTADNLSKRFGAFWALAARASPFTQGVLGLIGQRSGRRRSSRALQADAGDDWFSHARRCTDRTGPTQTILILRGPTGFIHSDQTVDWCCGYAGFTPPARDSLADVIQSMALAPLSARDSVSCQG